MPLIAAAIGMPRLPAAISATSKSAGLIRSTIEASRFCEQPKRFWMSGS